MSGFRRRYGASPLHALAHLAAFALAGFAVLQLVDARAAGGLLLWFVAAVVLHDLVLLPAYAGLDRVAQRMGGAGVNYLRVPAGLSGLLLLVYFPLILGRSTADARGGERSAGAGLPGRWLLISGVLFAGSAVLYVARSRTAAAKRPRGTAAATDRASSNVSTSRREGR